MNYPQVYRIINVILKTAGALKMKQGPEKNRDINKQVDQTLNVFDELDDLEPNPFFYTRLRSRIESQADRQKPGMEIFMPVQLRVPFIAVIVILNLVTGVFFFSNYQGQVSSDGQEVDTIAKEYYLNNMDLTY